MAASHKFVNVLAGRHGADVEADRTAIRSHVMKNYRRRQRQEQTQRYVQPDAEACSNISNTPLLVQIGHHQGTERPRCGTNCQRHTCCCSTGDTIGNAGYVHKRHETYQKSLGSCHTAPDSIAFPAEDGLGSVDLPQHDRRMIMSYSSQGSMAISQTLHSPDAFRRPLLQAFVEGFFPIRDQTRPVLVEGISQWAVARCQSMHLTNDAIGLMQLGVACQDRRLVTEGQRRQVLAVQCLRKEISKPGFSFVNVSCAAINMVASELYSATSSGAAGCAGHIAGLTAILLAHSRDPIAEPLPTRLLSHYHRLLLMHALTNRKAITFIKGFQPGTPGSVEALMHLSSQVPNLLEVSSRRFSKGSQRDNQHAVASLQAMARRLAKRFDEWLQDYENPGFRYRRSPLEFLSFLDANILGLYWLSRLLLAECLAQLHDIHTGNSGLGNPEAAKIYEEEADMYATYLFDAAVAIQKYDGSALSKGLAVRAPLHFAGQWWAKSADKKRLQRVLDLESRIRSELPAIDWDTLLYWSFVAIIWLT